MNEVYYHIKFNIPILLYTSLHNLHAPAHSHCDVEVSPPERLPAHLEGLIGPRGGRKSDEAGALGLPCGIVPKNIVMNSFSESIWDVVMRGLIIPQRAAENKR